MKKKLLLLMLSALCVAYCYADDNFITISANGVRKTYSMDVFQRIGVKKGSAIPEFNVAFSDKTATATGIKSILFNVAEEEPAPEEIEIETTESTATITWPTVPSAATYQLVIYTNESCTTRVCTLTFNSNGQLINIDFSPTGPAEVRSALASISFTVTGLEKNTTYPYNLAAMDAEKSVITEDSGTFKTEDVTLDGTPNEQQPQIYTSGKTIHVHCPSADNITFINSAGQQLGETVHTDRCAATVSIPGMYIVKTNNLEQKVIVR